MQSLSVQDYNILERVKQLEDRVTYFENCFNISERKLLEITGVVESFLKQLTDLNFGCQRQEQRYEASLDNLEKNIQLLRREIKLIEQNNDNKIHQLVNHLVEPSFKDVDQTIKQESQAVLKQCQQQINELQHEMTRQWSSNSKVDNIKSRIDEEVNRKVQEETQKRSRLFEQENKSTHKIGQMSTEKSRAREIQNRLALERKAKQDKINQLNELYEFRKN